MAAPGQAADNDTRLADAAMRRDVAAVRTLIGQKVDANTPGQDGTPALHWAVRVDDVATAKLLLGAGAQATLANRYGLTPLAIASANGNAAMIGVLLDAGADANAPDPAGDTPLMNAARVGSMDAVTLLLDRGSKIDAADASYQQTALMVAVRENHPDVVKLLISRGASVNAKTRVGRAPQWIFPNSVPGFGHGIGIVRGGLPPRGSRAPIPGGMSPLLYAARDGRMDIVRMLLDAGANINERDANDITPLIISITNNHPDVARFLIDRGADIKAVDWYGRTALWAAVETRNMDVDNGTFVNSIDRAPYLELIQVLHRPRRRPQRAHEGSAADSPRLPARHRIARVGGLHRTDLVSDGGACRRCDRDEAAAQARRGPEHPDVLGHDCADGRCGRELGVRSDLSTKDNRRCSKP